MEGMIIETHRQARPQFQLHTRSAVASVCEGPELSVLSYGVGQDSHAILLKLIYDREFRRKYAPYRLLVVTAETGDEHDETYETLAEAKELCKKHGINFVHITPDMGFHSDKWPDLRSFYNRTKTVGSKTFRKSCSDRLKLQPIYGFLEDYLGKTYNIPTGSKKGYGVFAAKYGKIRVMVGLAAGEEKRMTKPDAVIKDAWRRLAIETVYPLADIGYNREKCQKYIVSVGHKVPLPSNCKLCPFMSEEELVWMHRFLPQDLEDWIRIERNKIENNRHMDWVQETDKNGQPKFNKDGSPKMANKNYGVWGTKLLPEVLAGALEKYGHWSDDQLWGYKMSHGHCVASTW